ncbi:MAG TPA: hypothetical protein VGU74_02570 [Gemmatimonadales bacterium]|nr:hypothetical protein [Gemmatimonadales bacterium]
MPDVPSPVSDRPQRQGDPTLIWWSAAAIVLVVDSLLAVVLTNARDEGAPFLVGAVLAAVTIHVLICLVVYGVARVIGRGRTRVGRARLVFFTTGTLFLLNTAALATRFADTRVTDAERHGLQVTKDSLRHAAFGFALPLPSPDFIPSPELQRKMDSAFAKTPSMVSWVFQDTQTGAAITIIVAKLTRVSETGFRAFVTGARRGFKVSKFLSDTVSWQGESGEYRLDLLHPAGVYISMRCVPGHRPSAGGLIVCVQATTVRLHELESVTTGLKVASK